jgi:hypothetical protein
VIAQGLRRRGIDVTTTPEVSLISASDKEKFHLPSEKQELFLPKMMIF